MVINALKSIRFPLSIQLQVFIRGTVIRNNSTDVKGDFTKLKPRREIPGPKSLPFIGQLHHHRSGGELSNFGVGSIQKLYDKYGPIIRFDGLFGMGGMVVIADPEITAHVLRSENLLPLRPGMVSLEYYRKKHKKNKGNTGITGLATDHGEVWKKFRSLVNPVMLQPKTVKLYCTILDEVAQDMIKRIRSDRDENNKLRRDFESEMNLWALESIGTIALGCRLNCLDSDLPEDSYQKQLIQCIGDLFVVASELDFKPSVWRYISTPTFKKAMKLYERHEKLTKYFIKKGVEQLKLNSGQKSGHEKGVLEKLLDINDEYAYIMASDMLFAGVDTTANTLTATLYLLAKNQDKQDKLREEILSNPDSNRYVKACVKEGLRLMPVVSGNFRQATKEYNLMGYRIPKDVFITFSHREMALMDQHYPRAKEYIPERWIVEKNDPLYYGNTHPFVYAPFGFGTRSCIGRRIAELEIETFLARIVENFKVEWVGPPPELVSRSLIYMKGPLHFTFKDIQ